MKKGVRDSARAYEAYATGQALSPRERWRRICHVHTRILYYLEINRMDKVGEGLQLLKYSLSFRTAPELACHLLWLYDHCLESLERGDGEVVESVMRGLQSCWRHLNPEAQ